MDIELIDQLAALIIFVFIVVKGFVLLKDWQWLNTVTEKEKTPEPQINSKQVLSLARYKRLCLPKNLTGVSHEDYEEGIKRAV